MRSWLRPLVLCRGMILAWILFYGLCLAGILAKGGKLGVSVQGTPYAADSAFLLLPAGWLRDAGASMNRYVPVIATFGGVFFVPFLLGTFAFLIVRLEKGERLPDLLILGISTLAAFHLWLNVVTISGCWE